MKLELTDRVIELYREGKSLREIADRFRTTSHFIKQFLIENGVEIRKMGATGNMKHPWRMGYDHRKRNDG